MSKILSIGVTDLSFHRVTASLIAHVLNNMGFEVTPVYSPHEDNFKILKTGEVDLLNSAWLPSSHGTYKADVEDVADVSDLLKPDVIRKIKSTIQGINPGAGITRFSIKMMGEYGLSDAGYTFLTGTEEDCFGAFEQAVENNEWIVVPLWKPQFLHSRYNIREIREPEGLLGIVDRAVLLLREDKKSLFTEEQLQTLDSLRFSNDIIAELDYQVSRCNEPLDEVTQQCLASSGAYERPA